MAIQTINIGNVVNDGLGDDLRSAFQKVNANFATLDASLTPTAANAGTTGAGVFKEKVGSEFQFRNLVSGYKIILEEFTNSIRIDADVADAFVRIETENNAVIADREAGGNPNISIQGGDNITTSASGSTISIDTSLPVNQILTTIDFGGISTNYSYTTQFALAAANVDFGTITNPGSLSLDLGTI